MFSRSFTLPILLGLNFLIKFWVAVRPLKIIDGHTIPDDAYLCLTIARNIAWGRFTDLISPTVFSRYTCS